MIDEEEQGTVPVWGCCARGGEQTVEEGRGRGTVRDLISSAADLVACLFGHGSSRRLRESQAGADEAQRRF